MLTAKDDGWDKLRESLLERDGGCVAPQLQEREEGRCAGRLTLDHVKQHLMMGRKAPHDEAHLVVLCQYHHIDTRWATSHRNLERRYLRKLYPEVWGEAGAEGSS